MYNFGSPRVGNRAFAADYNQRVPSTWRIVRLAVLRVLRCLGLAGLRCVYAVCLCAPLYLLLLTAPKFAPCCRPAALPTLPAACPAGQCE